MRLRLTPLMAPRVACAAPLPPAHTPTPRKLTSIPQRAAHSDRRPGIAGFQGHGWRLGRRRFAMRFSFRRVGPLALSAALLAVGLVGCTEPLSETAGLDRALGLRLALRSDALGGSSEAFARVDAVHVIVTQAPAVLLDTTVVFASGQSQIALALRLPNPTATIQVSVELLSGGQALFSGSATVSAKRGATVAVPITVAPVIAGVGAPDSVTLTALGDTLRLRGVAVFASGDTVTGTVVTWAGDNDSVMRITPDGLVTALREGLARAMATYQGVTKTTRVRVQAVVTQLTLSADTFSLFVDSTRALTAAARDRRGNVLQRTIGWRSSDTTVAAVDTGGVVRGVGPGTATIFATSEAQSATVTVTVRRVPVGAVRLSLASSQVVVGGTVRLTAATLDVTGKVVTDRAITWSTSDAAVATVDSAGLVQAVAVGRAIITATSEGQRDTAVVWVVQPTVAASAGQLTFYAVPGQGPLTRVVSITNAGTGTLVGLSATVSYAQSTPAGWLAAALSRDTAPATLTLTADPGTLAPGTYTGTVTVASTVPGAGAVTVTVTLAVWQPIVGVSRTTIALQASWVSGVTDTLTVLNVGTGRLTGVVADVSYVANEPVGWLTLAPSSWQAVPAGGAILSLAGSASVPGAASPLPPGTYHATVTLSSGVPGAGTAQVAVTLAVIQPLVGVSAGRVSLYTVRAGAAPGAWLAVGNAGNGSLDGLSATVAYAPGQPAGWLTNASLGAATAPTTLALTADAAGLPIGTYTATVTVASTVPGAGPADVVVTFEVLEPLPAADVTYHTLHSTVRFWNVAIASVGAGTISGNTATVPPGTTIRVTGNWQIGPVTDVSYCPTCVIQVYVAWLNPAASSGVTPINQGLWSGILSVVNPNPGPGGTFDFTTTAPTVPGDYYIAQGGSLLFNYSPTVQGGPGWVTAGSPPNRWVSFRISVQ